MPPRAVGPYEIQSVVGRGGVGTVYRARDRRTGRLVALKVLGPAPAVDATAARRLAREFEALQDLDHPNIVRVFEAGVALGYSFLAMELVEGLDLRSYLSPSLDEDGAEVAAEWGREGSSSGSGWFDLAAWSLEPATDGLLAPLERVPPPGGAAEIRAFADVMEEPETDPGSAAPGTRGAREPSGPDPPAAESPLPHPALLAALNRPARIRRLEDALRQVCRALAYLHGRGFVHRDLKPSNIMVDDARRARLMDFGLVKPIREAQALTLAGRVVGTYRYMAPEQARGLALDGRADLYSLGVILYELLCGRPPFLARGAGEMWHEILERPPPPLRSLNRGADERLAAIAEKLLRKHPGERFQSAESLLEALEGPRVRESR